VDAGGLFNPLVAELSGARGMLEGVASLGVEIVNLTPGDARVLRQLGAIGKRQRPQFVSANVFGPEGKVIAPPYVVRRAADGRRIVFLGLSSVRRHETFGHKVDDPRETLRRLLPDVRQAGDLVVLLAFMSNREVVDIAVNVPGVDVIVSAYEQQSAAPPYQIGNAWILQSQYEGRFVGHVGLRWSGEGRLEKLEQYAFAVLDASFADDPEMAELVAGSKPVAAPIRPNP
jgi:2',3'-cyclic-nucleotide 2'-phosphodiesterase (5'-nucleotidase family)